jgi:hypothetical protein
VITLYSLASGKHAWQESCAHVGRLSYLAVQTYECALRSRFRAIHASRASAGTLTFALIPHYAALRVLGHAPNTLQAGLYIDIDISDLKIYQQLVKKTPALTLAMARFPTALGKLKEE